MMGVKNKMGFYDDFDMFDFLSQKKKEIFLSSSFVKDFLNKKVTIQLFLKNLREFTPDLIKKYKFNEEELDQIRKVSKIVSSELIYNKKEHVKLATNRYFVLADQFKEALPRLHKNVEPSYEIHNMSRLDFVKLYKRVYVKIAALNEKEVWNFVYNPLLPSKGPDPDRVWRFNNAKWSVKTISIKDMGVWPAFGGLDHFTTSGNLPDTVKKIKDILKGNTKYWPSNIKPNLPKKRITKLKGIIKYADLIYRLFPIIVTEKGRNTRRVDEKEWVKEELGMDYKITKYDIEDGNQRAVAFAMMGIKRIKCFVGTGIHGHYKDQFDE